MATFTLKDIKGQDVVIICSTYSNSRAWGHKAYTSADGFSSKTFITYYNRTWESFEYESLLYKVVNKYYKGDDLKVLEAQIKQIAQDKTDEAERWFNAIKETYNTLKPETKEKLKGVTLETKEQAEAIINSAALLDLIA